MPAPRNVDPTESLAALIGYELRRLRETAGKTQEALARALNYSGSLIGAVETATQAPSLDLCQRCDKALDTGGLLERLWWHMNRETSREAYPTWFQPFVEFERIATTLRVFEPVAVPGLLQTEAYARAVIRTTSSNATAEQVEELVTARMDRQAILDRTNPPSLVVLLKESVLSCVVGSREVMREQLEALLETAQRPRVIVQVVPDSAGVSASAAGMFIIATLNSNGGDIVYYETIATGQVTSRAGEVEACAIAFDVVRAEALPREASLDLIRKRKEEYEL